MAWPEHTKWRKGHPKLAGRKKGTPNKVTADVRATIKLIAERNVIGLEALLDRVAQKDPAKAADLYLKMLEFHTPKLQRVETTGLDGATTIVQSTPTDAKL